MTLDYPWFFIPLCLLLGLAYAAALYLVGKRKNPSSKTARQSTILLALLRTLSVSAISFLLLAPMTRRTVHERQKPHVVVAFDRSLSVRLSGDSSFIIPHSMLDNFRVTTVDFGNDAATDIGHVLEDLAGGDADAVILATDGIYNRGANPASVAGHLAMPVYTIALGDTTPQRDASIGALRTNRVAMLGTTLPVEFTATATLLRGHNAQLTVTDSKGRTLHRQNLSYPDDAFSQDIALQMPIAEAGLQRINISLSVVEGEVSRENNVLSFYVDVIDTRRRVAIVSNAPHPDLAALRHAIEANPNYEADVLLYDEIKMKNDALKDYSLIILHNLPSSNTQLPTLNSQASLLFIIGLQTDLSRFNALHTGLEINARVQRTNEVTAIFHPEFSLFSIPDDDASAIEQLPPLSAPFGEARLTDGVQTLFSARLANIDTRQPLIAATTGNGGLRRVFVWGEGLWRWRLADYATSGSHDRFDRLIQQLVSFASINADKARLRIEADRTYPAGQPIVLRAQLYNEAYQLTNTPEVKLTLNSSAAPLASGEGTNQFSFHRDGDDYSLTLPDLPEGIYRYRAEGDGQVAEGSFAVEALNLERRTLVADHALLRTISETTGGQMLYPDQLSSLQSHLSALKPVIYSHTR